MDQEGICTMWFTLSSADNHWVDLHRLLYGKEALLPDLNGPDKCKPSNYLENDNHYIIIFEYHE